MGVLKGICVSKKRGTKKVEVAEAMLVENYGIEGDAHAGNWHRQVSLLSLEKIEAFREKGAQVSFGDFGENLIIDGFDFRSLPVGTIFTIGDAVLKMTQIGECIMPREGVFAVVLKGGQIRNGDTVEMVPVPSDAPLTAAVITLSDKGSKGEREDKSGPVIVKMLEEAGYEIIESNILPDEQKLLENELIRLSDQRQVNLILTTGGTGFSERDRTPEATMTVATRLAPGIAEAIRAGSMKITKRAMLSRETSVIRNKTLIVNLPGSPKAVAESLELVIDQLDHGIKILLGRTGECARN